MALLAFFSLSILTACNNSERKLENAEDNVEEANEDLDDAREDYAEDVAMYRKINAERIAANNKSIQEFNERMAQDKAIATDDYRKKIADINQKNTDLQKRIDGYEMDNKDNWEIFKAEFNKDMDALSEAFESLKTDKKK